MLRVKKKKLFCDLYRIRLDWSKSFTVICVIFYASDGEHFFGYFGIILPIVTLKL